MGLILEKLRLSRRWRQQAQQHRESNGGLNHNHEELEMEFETFRARMYGESSTRPVSYPIPDENFYEDEDDDEDYDEDQRQGNPTPRVNDDENETEEIRSIPEPANFRNEQAQQNINQRFQTLTPHVAQEAVNIEIEQNFEGEAPIPEAQPEEQEQAGNDNDDNERPEVDEPVPPKRRRRGKITSRVRRRYMLKHWAERRKKLQGST